MERCAFLFLLGCLAFNWPFVEIFGAGLVAYLYGTWLAYIVLLAIVSRRATGADKETGPRSARR